MDTTKIIDSLTSNHLVSDTLHQVNTIKDSISNTQDVFNSAFTKDAVNNLWPALEVTVKGMGGIFIFMVIFFFIIQGLDKLFPKKEEN
ncbi:MAG: OadG-related small transporter subunit [Syntrophothermus sp.]